MIFFSQNLKIESFLNHHKFHIICFDSVSYMSDDDDDKICIDDRLSMEFSRRESQ